MSRPQTKRVHPRWWWLTGILLVLTLGIGCSPTSIGWLMLPFMDQNIQPRCKLAKKKEEVALVIYARFVDGEVPLDLEPAANELADVLAGHLRKRYAANKEKVTIVAPSRVRSFMVNNHGKVLSDQEIGEHFKADYVIAMEISKLSLYEKSNRTLFRGQTDIAVTVTDCKAEEGEQRIFNQMYSTSFPTTQIIETTNSSPLQFRTLFINHVTRELSRWFAAYPKDERMEMQP